MWSQDVETFATYYQVISHTVMQRTLSMLYLRHRPSISASAKAETHICYCCYTQCPKITDRTWAFVTNVGILTQKCSSPLVTNRGGNLLAPHDSIRFRFRGQRFDSKSILDASQCNKFFMYISMHDLITSYFFLTVWLLGTFKAKYL